MKIFSHCLVALLSFLIFTQIQKQKNHVEETKQPLMEKRPQTSSHSQRVQTMKSADYRQAWNELTHRKLDAIQRSEAQKELLRKWAEIDLDSALTAFFDSRMGVSSMVFSDEDFYLEQIFGKTIFERQLDVLEMIKAQKLGILNSNILGKAWVRVMIKKDPDQLMNYIKELNGTMLEKAFTSVQFTNEPKQYLLKMLENLQQNNGESIRGFNLGFIVNVDSYLSAEEIREHISATSSTLQNKLTQALAYKFAKNSPTQYRSGEFEQEISRLPQEAREAFAKRIIAIEPITMNLFMETVSYIASNQQWASLSNHDFNEIKDMMGNMPPRKLAEWSYQLPERKETTEIFHRSVEPYIQSNPQESWQWIQEMPSGYWKDRALAEFSQQSLHHFNNPDQSLQAINQIKDPAYRSEVQGWRKAWEDQKK